MTDPVLQLRLLRIIDAALLPGPKASEPAAFSMELVDRLLSMLDAGAGDLAEAETADVPSEVELAVADDEPLTPPDAEMAPPIPQSALTAVDLPPLFTEDTGQIEWSSAHDLLYEDILWLFKTGDNEGAIEALGRLMDLADGTPELLRFLEINQKKLLGLFEKLVGPIDGKVKVNGDTDFEHRYFHDPALVRSFINDAAAGHSIGELANGNGNNLIRTYSMLFRLGREGMIENPAPGSRS
jgi:hypothetical protein